MSNNHYIVHSVISRDVYKILCSIGLFMPMCIGVWGEEIERDDDRVHPSLNFLKSTDTDALDNSDACSDFFEISESIWN